MPGRLPTAALLVAATLVFSGCHELLRVTLGAPDPPVHNPPPAKRRAVAHAAAGTAFTGIAEGRLASRVVLRHGFVKSTMKNVRFAGTFTAGDESLGALRSAQWHGRFTAVRDRATYDIKLTGLLLATFDDPSGGRACVRLGYRNVRSSRRASRRTVARNRKRGRGVVTVIGGEGGARTLGGKATVRVRLLSGERLRLRGRATTKQVAARGMPAACTKLERQFGLAPLSS